MIVGIKDALKLVGIFIVTACAVFVCALFLNYNIDLAAVSDSITSAEGRIMYEAHISMGKVVCAVTGGCLALTTVVMLLFYIKNYIDSHKKELGILKALGYSRGSLACRFSVFGISVFVGTSAGFLGAWCYMPSFYSAQTSGGELFEVPMHLHVWLVLLLTAAPSAAFAAVSILYACIKLKMPAADLLRERERASKKTRKKADRQMPFLKSMRKNTLRERKMLVFFMAFSAFCFSSMTQMSMSMNTLASDTFAWMILTIGLILAFTTLFMSLTTVIKTNAKSAVMMRVYGYSRRECSSAVLGAYRPVTYIGFAVGSVYQYVLLRAVLTITFADVEVPEYSFDTKALAISFVLFAAVYEAVMHLYSARLDRQSPKIIMSE